MNIEKEVWEQTEKHLREEKDSIVKELQSKLSTLQVSTKGSICFMTVVSGKSKMFQMVRDADCTL